MMHFIKIGLAILLMICLLDMPYGYYQFVRFLALIGFGILAFDAYQKESQLQVMLYAVLALLFQPFLKVSLGRTLWNIVDVIVAIGLILSIVGLIKSNKK